MPKPGDRADFKSIESIVYKAGLLCLVDLNSYNFDYIDLGLQNPHTNRMKSAGWSTLIARRASVIVAGALPASRVPVSPRLSYMPGGPIALKSSSQMMIFQLARAAITDGKPTLEVSAAGSFHLCYSPFQIRQNRSRNTSAIDLPARSFRGGDTDAWPLASIRRRHLALSASALLGPALRP